MGKINSVHRVGDPKNPFKAGTNKMWPNYQCPLLECWEGYLRIGKFMGTGLVVTN